MPMPPEVSTVGPPAAAVGERRQLAELANCFGAAVRAWLAFQGCTPEQAQEWTAAFFREVAPSELALPGSGGGRLRRIVFHALEDWSEGKVDLPRDDQPDAARHHFYSHWGRALAFAARRCFEEDLRASPDAALAGFVDPILAGPLRAATVESLAATLQCARGPALARVHFQRLHFGGVVRSLIDASVGDPFEIEGEIHELAKLVESAPGQMLGGTAPGCRSCQRLLLPDVPGLVCPSCLLRAGHTSALEAARIAAAEADSPAEGDRFSHYELLEEIGRGGMGVIHRARDRDKDCIVAVKLLQPGLAASAELRERFRREAKAMSSLDHENILPVYEVGERGALPFFAMKLVDGGSLVECVARLSGKHREIASLVCQVARAVHHAHERGLLHRDIKPANVLLDRAGRPYVTDFGLARWIDDPGGLTRSLVVLGTAGYVAPEQAEGSGNAISPRADVYSLGVLLFELLTATRPFSGENALSVLRQAAVEPPPPARSRRADVPRPLEAICHRALQPNPQARYPSAAELANDLDDWLAGRSVRGTQAPWHVRFTDGIRRHRWKSAVAAGLCLSLLGWLVGALPYEAPHRLDHPRNREATSFLKSGVRVRDGKGGAEGLEEALSYMQSALELDPSFAAAHAELSRLHSKAYWSDVDRTEKRARLAKEAADRAIELKPNLPRALLAQGEYWFRCRRKDERAMHYLRLARQGDAEDVDAVGLIVMVAKRVHRWDEAIEAAEQLCRIKPRDPSCLYDLAVTYEVVRRYDDAERAFNDAYYHAPDKDHYIANLGWVRFRRDGQTAGLGRYIQTLKLEKLISQNEFATVFAWHTLERRWVQLRYLADALPADFVLRDSTTWWPREFILAQIQLGQGEDATQNVHAAEQRLEERLASRPDDGRAHSTLARVLALQGKFDEALVAARRGAELVPVEHEPVNGPERLVDLAEVLLRAGQFVEARDLLARLLSQPGYLTRHDLRLDPRWDFARERPELAEWMR